MEWIDTIHGFVWGIPALVLMLGIGVYITVRTGFVQFALFPEALKAFGKMLIGKGKKNAGVSQFQALCTALAATVGTGNLVGVAGSICLGGPGSIFWMWIFGFLGMATKFAEATLAVRYRISGNHGFSGGPMYMIRYGLGEKWKWLGWIYALFGVFAAFGIGNAAQVNAFVAAINDVIGYMGKIPSEKGNLVIGLGISGFVLLLMSGGAARIGRAAERIVPFAAGGYVILCFVVLAIRLDRIPGAFSSIICGAFSPQAVTGGMIGSMFQSLRVGCARGVFTNEAGMGTASIAHAGAEVDHPVEQGLMGIVEVFLDTVVMCSLTALVILVSGVPVSYGVDSGVKLTNLAFSALCGDWISVAIAVALALFAVATIMGWGLYGGRCTEYIIGTRSWKWFILADCVVVIIGAVMRSEVVWKFSEIFNGLMAIPNLIALGLLCPELVKLIKEFKRK